MNTFVNNIATTDTAPAVSNIVQTDNGMRAYASTKSKCLDYFYTVGANRGNNLTSAFAEALNEDMDVAVRLMLWSRDARNGAGERDHFIQTMDWLDQNGHNDIATHILRSGFVQSLGRWKDMIEFSSPMIKDLALTIMAGAILSKDGLACKWAPRKGVVAEELRKKLGFDPKSYRKWIVQNTTVVETQMCAKQWDDIEFAKVPSRAQSDYRKAFARNTTKYAEYLASVEKGESKINAGAVYPYDVLKPINYMGAQYKSVDPVVQQSIELQWAALPDFVGDNYALPIIDVSGSMTWTKVTPTLEPIHIAVSMGLYVASKNKGAWKDVVLEFDDRSKMHNLSGMSVVEQVKEIYSMGVGGSTNLHSTFEVILGHALQHKVPQEDMPKTVVIFSDMQFNHCVNHDDTAIGMIRRKYEDAGYDVPKVIFWNLNSGSNKPATAQENGVVLVSGFSPTLFAKVLNDGAINPEESMMAVVMDDRYTWQPMVQL